MSSLTRDEMIEKIRGGEGIIYKGVTYHSKNVHTLPSKAEMALNDPNKIESVREEHMAEIARLTAELSKLPTAEVEVEAPTEKVSKVKAEKA